MSYTIPEYVDTQEQAILAVASAVKGEQVTGGDGSVNTALDILADTLAGENVQVPMTQQGAILALAQYVDGMVKPEGTITITENGEGIDVAQYATADVSVSGGGADVGEPTLIIAGNSAPEPGGYISNTAAVGGLAIGSTTIVPTNQYNAIFYVASGCTATTYPDEDANPTTCAAYVVTVDDEEFTAVAPWDGTLTQGTWTGNFGDLNVWSFTVPALEFDTSTYSGQILYLYKH